MNFNIRNAVKNNLQYSSREEIYQIILDASKTDEENVLPGLGVILELLWSSLTNEEKLERIREQMRKASKKYYEKKKAEKTK